MSSLKFNVFQIFAPKSQTIYFPLCLIPLLRFFKKCPHPDEDQQKQLASEAGLDHKQVMFWFQNRRDQAKVILII
uniref:Homeobox domain-containing protein n=1 Tax=Solanum lycopersicum TaxID=4081 RepID=K4CTE7_SOLLC